MFKLAHISDVHLSPLPHVPLASLLSKRITGYFNWKLNRNLAYDDAFRQAILDHLVEDKADHLAITGDLTNLALRAEIDNVMRWLDALQGRFGNENALSVIAGNHDAYVPRTLKRCLLHWQEHVKGDDDRKILGSKDFPVLKRRKDVSLISCNSARATLPFSARGFFNKSQSERLANMLAAEKGRFRVVMIHHPPIEGAMVPLKRLVGIKHFQNAIFKHGCELVLHGHSHLATTHWLDGPTHRIPVIGVPATAQVPGSVKPPAGYNMFEISKQNKKWQCYMKSFGFRHHSTLATGLEQTNELKIL